MKGRILFHKHNQELRTKSKALVFLLFFSVPPSLRARHSLAQKNC